MYFRRNYKTIFKLKGRSKIISRSSYRFFLKRYRYKLCTFNRKQICPSFCYFWWPSLWFSSYGWLSYTFYVRISWNPQNLSAVLLYLHSNYWYQYHTNTKTVMTHDMTFTWHVFTVQMCTIQLFVLLSVPFRFVSINTFMFMYYKLSSVCFCW